ncbi:FecR family protein [Bacteroides faecalis]|uniref:Anti-sigma factor n=1 Tax=Bacteroides faecalis TaxID=2447885 RepID=A0A401LZI6_9BACE|nr:FecR domain-containing protein [Bacteroides faecalis]GCB36895.1 anti-sigma factor [Bacteroides faecalis]
MKYTDTEIDKILNRLVASTRSPRGKFSASASYPKLERRLKPRIRHIPIQSFRVAAAVVLLCLSVCAVHWYATSTSIQTVSTLAKTRYVSLPDGTSVTLNHFSSLTYPKDFNNANREVTLTGEAYFEVTKDKKHPFIVQAGPVNVQVLGTHFNIDAYPNNPDIRTTLLEGSVAVSNTNNTIQLVLEPNQMAIYNKVENSLIRKEIKNSGDEISWRQGELIFNDTSLKEIVRELSNSFNVDIQIQDTALQNYCITAHFPKNEKLETILTVLHQAGHFDYSKTNDQIIITTKQDLK